MSSAASGGYVELQTTSNFSFLRGASHPHELVQTAAALGHAGAAIADRNTLAGVVRAHVAAKKAGIPLVVGARLDLSAHYDAARDESSGEGFGEGSGGSVLCFPTDRAAYGRLARLLSRGKTRAPKGSCWITLEDLQAASAGQMLVVLGEVGPGETWRSVRDQLVAVAPGRVFTGASPHFDGRDRSRLARLYHDAHASGAPLVALGDALYHDPARRPLQDVLTCIREGCTIQEAGRRLEANAERALKPAAEMARLFAGYHDAVARSVTIARACRFSLDELSYAYPNEPVPDGMSPQEGLERLTWLGAEARYDGPPPERVAAMVRAELALIAELDYAPYFLTVHDIVAWARGRGILCQGRGSAANSAVCYCLGITSVDPAKMDVLFARFISKERREPPDIDVDFEHERREEVIQYIYRRYGRARAALTATVISYRPRSAVREVCKALGLSADVAGALAGTVWGSWGRDVAGAHVKEAGLDPDNPLIAQALALTHALIGFPRHLSQHVGGFVLTRGPLVETVPVANAAMADRTVIEWDKDDIDALGIMKVDVLALGMLSCIRKCFDLIAQHYGRRLDLARVPQDDPGVYDMLCAADSVGVFQVESRAQMNMLPRLRPRTFYDLVIEVAIVRPGPIQGEMVHPYLRRRQGKEPVRYPKPAPEHGPPDELERILGRTLGVPLFQEQAMRIAIEAAKFTPDEANGLRRAMATFRKVGTIQNYQDKMVQGMARRGYEPDFAQRCFDQIKGFGEYGFPESHAASFALLVYVSAWLKRRYPAVFACGLLNAQPMGFYAPAQIVRDARAHGVTVREVDVNHSDWDHTLEADGAGGLALRLGLRLVEGLSAAGGAALMAGRAAKGVFDDITSLRRRTGLSRSDLEALAAADACRSMGLDRRAALWMVRGLGGTGPLDLFAHADAREEGAEAEVALPATPAASQVLQDYQTTRLSVKAHPLSFLRAGYARAGVVTTRAAVQAGSGRWVRVAGLVLVRQRPGTAKGVVFLTLEDETGVANVIVWPKVMERYRAVVMGARIMAVHGQVQSAEGVTHIIAHRLSDQTDDLASLEEGAARAALERTLAHADEVRRPVPTPDPRGHPRNARVIPKSRDFH